MACENFDPRGWEDRGGEASLRFGPELSESLARSDPPGSDQTPCTPGSFGGGGLLCIFRLAAGLSGWLSVLHRVLNNQQDIQQINQ